MLCSGQDLRVKVSNPPFCLTSYFQAAGKGPNLEKKVLDMVQTTFAKTFYNGGAASLEITRQVFYRYY